MTVKLSPSVLWRHLLFTTIIFSELFLASVFACSCMLSHPQSLYCQSEYVVKALVVKPVQRFDYIKPSTTTLKIIRIFKGNESSLNEMGTYPLVTLEMSPLCEDGFTKGNKYLIHASFNNGSLGTHLCWGNKSWFSLSKVMRRGLARYYNRHCECKHPRFVISECHHKHSFLSKRNNQCVWARTKYFKKCWECGVKKKCTASVH
ncbi:tissue inhibitor of metalloproteinase [Octopus vulgaris]|uniref:Tissue inhibitor of metalloproteinase n=1 Tax=Octopus vulgaris TaxID=6645 RepID=A0AA36B9R9_OCTVU|nr:tissue inhibitor of metalloproteinase [Octopus vulgaris]